MFRFAFSALLASVVLLPASAGAIEFAASKTPDYGDTIKNAYSAGQKVTGKPTYTMKYNKSGATGLKGENYKGATLGTDTIGKAYSAGQKVTGKPTHTMKYAAGATGLNTDKGSAAAASRAVLGGDTLSKGMKTSQKITNKPTQKIKYDAGATGLAAETGNGFSL